jgi:hypothetical protein
MNEKLLNTKISVLSKELDKNKESLSFEELKLISIKLDSIINEYIKKDSSN